MIKTAGAPLHDFMMKQTRTKDVTMFAQMAKSGPYASPADVPWSVALPAFVTSELKTAFQIGRSEAHTSELQSLMRISYAVFCLKQQTKTTITNTHHGTSQS